MLSLSYRFAYVEFVEKESVENALKLDDTTFKGRQIKVTNALPNDTIVLIIMLLFVFFLPGAS